MIDLLREHRQLALAGAGGVWLALVGWYAVLVAAGRATPRLTDRVIVGAGAVLLAVAVVYPASGDLAQHIMMWDVVLSGSNPWAPEHGNYYGPLFQAMALPRAVHPHLPRVLYTLVWLVVVWWLVGQSRRCYPDRPRLPGGLVLLLLLNPYFVIMVPLFGRFDLTVTALLVAAVAQRWRRNDLLAGLCVGAAVLYKVYPILLLPFLLHDQGRLRWRLLGAAGLTIGLGFLAGYLLWGAAVLFPFTGSQERQAQAMSLFVALKSPWSPLRWFVAEPNLDVWSMKLMAAATLLAWWHCWRRDGEPATSCAIGWLAAMLVCKLGHSQFHIVTLLLLPTAALRQRWLLSDRPLRLATGCYATVLCLNVVVEHLLAAEAPLLDLYTLALSAAMAVMLWRLWRGVGPADPVSPAPS